LQTDPDIELVLVTDALDQPHYQDVVQQIRSQWTTRYLPIGLLVRDGDRLQRARLTLADDPYTLVLPLATDPRYLHDQIGRLRQTDPVVSLANSHRGLHADVARRWLSRTLADPQIYRFYHLACYRDQLADVARKSRDHELGSEMLLHLGTPKSQRLLVELASDSSLSIDQRQKIAESFASSTRNNGVLLTTQEIRQSVDRFSKAAQSESTDADRLILDSLISRQR
jgi:hypothetical protein